ncbi:hypothetical protein I4U23_013374 [Adineta vaga]|nr:hypothetical protein I4U23_013374 [Adineta vaga]
MNKEALIDIGSQLSRLRLYPIFDICHYLITALHVREDIQQYPTVTQNFTRRHPFSCWLSTMLLCFSNTMLTNFLLGESLIQDFLQHQHLLLATICWYCVFYSPLDLLGRFIRFLPIRLVIGVGKEIYRTRKIYDGVRSTLVIYPEAYIVIILIGAIRGCGGSIMSSIDRFIRGIWLPTQHEFLFPSFTTKACFLSSVIFLLSQLQILKFEHELIYLCIASMFIYVRIITLFFKQYDPFMPFENIISGLLFNSWTELFADAYRRAAMPNTLPAPQNAALPATMSSLTSTAGMANIKKETMSNEASIKGFDGKKRD